MGSQQSQADDSFALPQQQIVSYRDGAVHGTAARPAGGGQRGPPPRVGNTREVTAVHQPIVLPRDALQFRRRGRGDSSSVSVTVMFQANVHGVVELFAPGIEIPRSTDGRDDRAHAHAGDKSATWPVVEEADGGVHLVQLFKKGNANQCTFDFVGSALPEKSRARGRWPFVLLFWPGVPAESLEPLRADPPDGAVLVACALQREQAVVQKQLVAWGRHGAAFVISELYGIAEAQQQQETGGAGTKVDNNALCVVCLSSPKDCALLPCGHLCVCYECGASLRLNPSHSKCPLCRQPVKDLTHFKGIKHAA